MIETRVLELKTTADVEDFCRALLKAKRLGPASVSFMVALTVRRDVETRTINGRRIKGDPIVSILNSVDPQPLPQTVLPPRPQETPPTPQDPVSPPPVRTGPTGKRYRRGIIGLK